MSDIKLTCEETPLKWPSSIALTDLSISSTSAMLIHAPQSGTLQILTRRAAGGVGDGVNIEESTSLGVDYRGQRFSLDEAILHVPGLHIFPGQTDVYPAEYHIHFKTLSAPFTFVTVVVPISHKAADLSGGTQTAEGEKGEGEGEGEGKGEEGEGEGEKGEETTRTKRKRCKKE